MAHQDEYEADEEPDPPWPSRAARLFGAVGAHGHGGAKVLNVSRQTLNNVVNEKTGISAEMAIRLSKAFGSTPETWLAMQMAFDLAQARKLEGRIKVKRYESLQPEAAA